MARQRLAGWLVWAPLVGGLLAFALAVSAAGAAAAPLRVATTTTDLASLVEAVGGDEVEVTAFAKGGQDPHFIEARPSFIRVLSRADLFVETGLKLEEGWVPALLRSARNTRVQPGGEGHLEASAFVELRGIPTGTVDRSMGDVHGLGNPHYLTDPVSGLRVSRAIAAALTRLRPEQAAVFEARAKAFETTLVTRLVGEAVVDAHGLDAVTSAVLEDRLEALAPPERWGGWLGRMWPHRGRAVVADHDLWPYFAHRFGIEVVGFLEPLPGVAPTTRHLSEIATLIEARDIRAILAASYFNPRHAKKVAAATGARVVEMANQVGARDGADDYLDMIDWNVRGLADALD